MAKFAGPGSRPVSFIKIYLPIISGQAAAHREYLANQQSTYNENDQRNLLIDSVPLSAHKNNYLIKLIILLNKTGRLPGPANFPIKLQCCHFANSGYLSLLYDMSSFLNIAEIRN